MLPARWALIVMFGMHALTFVGGVYDTIAGHFVAGALPALNSWFGLISFESLVLFDGHRRLHGDTRQGAERDADRTRQP